MAGLHMALHAPTAIYQEVVRATLATWYRDIVTDLPVIEAGMAQPPVLPGLGARLKDSFKAQPGLCVRMSR
jgi:L-alanine-DL-glutamate epimerase-like enolase superfamily enzyme